MRKRSFPLYTSFPAKHFTAAPMAAISHQLLPAQILPPFLFWFRIGVRSNTLSKTNSNSMPLEPCAWDLGL